MQEKNFKISQFYFYYWLLDIITQYLMQVIPVIWK